MSFLRDWLADVLNNLGNFLKDGEAPCFTIIIDGVEIEIRLNNIPGQFNRQQIKMPNAELSGGPPTGGKRSHEAKKKLKCTARTRRHVRWSAMLAQ